jgi:Zn-dependent protease with chaperone function
MRPAVLAFLVALPALAATIDPAALDQGGDLAYRKALQPALDGRRLNVDRAAFARSRAELNRIIVGAPAIAPTASAMHWTVNLLTDPVPDVLAFPGGRLLVHSGFVADAGLTDEEQAAVVAHVVAHALLGHDRARLETLVAPDDAADPDPNRRALAVAAAAAAEAKRRAEPAAVAAADRASVELLARAAYSPKAAASAWRKLDERRSPLAARYPVTPERLTALETAAEAAMPLYRDIAAKAAQMPRGGPPFGPTRAIR